MKFNDCKCQEKMFTDRLPFDTATKTVVSVRDGVQEYMGAEIGQEPADKVFTVYRSPATVGNIALDMASLPLTDNHIEVGGDVPNPVGKVLDAKLVDLKDDAVSATLGVRNGVELNDTMLGLVESGKRELSLGYNARLVPHDTYDFEQLDIAPHHLAVVDAGRCGSACSFIDNETDAMKITFLDEDGNLNLEEMVNVVAAMPEAIKKVPVDKLAEIAPKLQEIAAMANPEPPAEEPVADEEEVTDMDEDKEEVTDEDGDKEEDEKDFSDAVTKAVAAHADVIVKAQKFLDADYAFKGKSTDDIMRDAVATQHKQKFEDAELAVAFKMLVPQSRYQQFGDSGKGEEASPLELRITTDLEG